MGLNVKEIHLRFCRMVQDSTKSSYTFVQKHPLVSGAMLVCFILYMFLSYIYSFLVYLSPFLVCTAIFVRIFWSSEQTQFKYVKREEGKKEEQRRVEPKRPKIPINRRRELLYKYPSQNATSRRRNFRGRKLDVYGGLEEKAKDLSAVFHNEFTSRNTKGKEVKFSEKGESSLDHGLSTEKIQPPKRQTLRSEPSMRDLVVEAFETKFGSSKIGREKMEDGDDEDEDETQEDRNKAIEWTEEDQKNLMDLGISELERNRRLESLMAKRKERKLFRFHPENGLADKKSPIPSHIAPVLISRGNPFDQEMPGSAPSVVPRSPYDIPYDPSEEKPNLTGGSFHQEFTIHQKDMPFSSHESFSLGPNFPSEPKQEHGDRESNPFFNSGRNYPDRPAYPTFKKLPGDNNILHILIIFPPPPISLDD